MSSTSFVIGSSNGVVSTTGGGLDREAKDTYLMTVVATDGGGRRAGLPLTIEVDDLNDETPHFQGRYSTRVQENSVDLTPSLVLRVGSRGCGFSFGA